MKVLCVITSSHRQVDKLPKGLIARLLNGRARTLGTKDRLWYYPDTQEMRIRLKGFRIYERESKKAGDALLASLRELDKFEEASRKANLVVS